MLLHCMEQELSWVRIASPDAGAGYRENIRLNEIVKAKKQSK